MKRGFYAKGVKTRCHKPGLKGVEKSDLLSELERAVKDLEVNPPCPRSLPHKDSRSTSFEGFFCSARLSSLSCHQTILCLFLLQESPS